MVLKLNDREVEVTLDSNRDGSRFVTDGYYIDSLQDLTSDELDQIQEQCDDDINSDWRG
jgi:hypothetical protein